MPYKHKVGYLSIDRNDYFKSKCEIGWSLFGKQISREQWGYFKILNGGTLKRKESNYFPASMLWGELSKAKKFKLKRKIFNLQPSHLISTKDKLNILENGMKTFWDNVKLINTKSKKRDDLLNSPLIHR